MKNAFIVPKQVVLCILGFSSDGMVSLRILSLERVSLAKVIDFVIIHNIFQVPEQ